MVCTILSLQNASRSLRPPTRWRMSPTGKIQWSPERQPFLPRHQRPETFSQTDYPTLWYSPPYAATFVNSTLRFAGFTQRRRTAFSAWSWRNPLSLQSGNCTFLLFNALLHAHTGAETCDSWCCPPCRNGHLLRWHYRYGRNNGTTDRIRFHFGRTERPVHSYQPIKPDTWNAIGKRKASKWRRNPQDNCLVPFHQSDGFSTFCRRTFATLARSDAQSIVYRN